ncbi:MAG: hypothetical protein DRN81_01725 [Thermoproteota archaeon]|nr:MAG: hypothetical protein DRN81_01725 [Candidatus Korarchaeota archaeon]
MRKFGVIIGITNERGFLIEVKNTRIARFPNVINRNIYSKDGKLIGIIRDVIGPVSSPYATAKILIQLEKASSYINKPVYVENGKIKTK